METCHRLVTEEGPAQTPTCGCQPQLVVCATCPIASHTQMPSLLWEWRHWAPAPVCDAGERPWLKRDESGSHTDFLIQLSQQSTATVVMTWRNVSAPCHIPLTTHSLEKGGKFKCTQITCSYGFFWVCLRLHCKNYIPPLGRRQKKEERKILPNAGGGTAILQSPQGHEFTHPFITSIYTHPSHSSMNFKQLKNMTEVCSLKTISWTWTTVGW